jgi:hypothetical protein
MRMAWKRNLEYRLKTICCRQMSRIPLIQKQNSKWYLFDHDEDHDQEFYLIKFCPFCGKRLDNSVNLSNHA